MATYDTSFWLSLKGYSTEESPYRDVDDNISSNALRNFLTLGHTATNTNVNSIRTVSALPSSIISVESPESIRYAERVDEHQASVYAMCTYWYSSCSILSTVTNNIVSNALRDGIEWHPLFESKCPNCKTPYPATVSYCSVCEFEGKFLTPDESQKGLFINYEGGSMLDKVNKHGWDLMDLAHWFALTSLVYNQPICLAKSAYLVDEYENVHEEQIQEFVPVSPIHARMHYDERGAPGNGTMFRISDRRRKYHITDKDVAETGRTKEGYRLYPARWEIAFDEGNAGDGVLYTDKEIYHKTFGLTSINYGTPIATLLATDIRAWIAYEKRIEMYLSRGHPPGFLIINGIDPDAFQSLRKDVSLTMRDDPYNIPIISTPPIQDKVTNIKWLPVMSEPSENMISLKQELLERIVSAFGSSILMYNDTEAMKGTAGPEAQMSITDRTLTTMRRHINKFFSWIISKFPTITDWGLRVVEPSDNAARDKLEEENRQLVNAQLYKALGFQIKSQKDGQIEISETPAEFDPLTRLLDPAMTDPTTMERIDGIEGSPDKDVYGEVATEADAERVTRSAEKYPSKTPLPEDSLDFAFKSDGVVISAEEFGRAFAAAVRSGVRFK